MKHKIFRITTYGSMFLLMALYLLDIATFDSSDTVGMTITRACASAMFVSMLLSYGTDVWGIKCGFGRAVLLGLPAFLVAVNNFPWIPFLSGGVTITADAKSIAMLALECIFIGIFEEAAFRGIILELVLDHFGGTKKGVFNSILITSAAFGLIHLFNLFAGAGFGTTLQQVGYSFLIGGMCAIVFVGTRCLPLAMLIHAIYDFCGYLIPRCGEGEMWTVPEITLTAVLGVLAFAYYLVAVTKLETRKTIFER